MDPQGRAAAPAERIDRLIGNTPLVRLARWGDPSGAPIFVKMDDYNPSGSIRDRYIAEILERGVEAGQIQCGDSIALAGIDDSALAAALIGQDLELSVHCFAPPGVPRRLLGLIERVGAAVHWLEEGTTIDEAYKRAAAWARSAPDRLFVDGFRRQAVRDAYDAIADEIVRSLGARSLGAFVTSVTTGGTYRQLSPKLRQAYPGVIIAGAVLVDFEPERLRAHPDDVLRRFDPEAVWALRAEIARSEGLLLGPKGAACVALARELQSGLAPDRAVVALNPDCGARYIGWESGSLFARRLVPSFGGASDERASGARP